MSTRKFYKTVITTVVVSEQPLSDLETLEIHQQNVMGDLRLSLVNDRTKDSEEIDGPTAAKLLLDQNSDPELFDLDENGNDIDEGDDDAE